MQFHKQVVPLSANLFSFSGNFSHRLGWVYSISWYQWGTREEIADQLRMGCYVCDLPNNKAG